jgi:uncharacterized damage-inducible protein DinB
MTQKTATEKDMFIEAWEHEFETALRVFREIPAGKEDFRPAPISRTTRELVGIIISGETVIEGALSGTLPSAPAPTGTLSIADLIRRYEAQHRDLVARAKSSPETRMDATIPFPVGLKRMEDKRVGQVMWMMLMDHVHHRGQMSVYLRLLGAKVPAICGPSADEPWK